MRKWLFLGLLLLSQPAAALLAASPPRAAELQSFTRGSWQTLRTAHAGQPTIVHFWGLTCAPCLVELARWGELLRDRPGLDLVLIAADPLADDEPRISATLKKAGLSAAESWGFADRFAERLRFEIDKSWRGELPRTLLISKDAAVTTISGVADLAAVRAWLDRETARYAFAPMPGVSRAGGAPPAALNPPGFHPNEGEAASIVTILGW